MKRLLKIISLALVLIIILTSLLSCSARPLAQSKLAKKVVGTVGSHDVYYEELYFLANGYKNVAKENHGDDSEAVNKAILDYVSENIIENYAVLDLCAAEGLEYNERKLRSEVNKKVELTINTYFEGDKKAYLQSQLEAGMTDHYYRFCTGVDLLYGKLATKYQTEGKIPNTDEDIKNYIKENFVHTIHVAVYVDKNDDREKEYAKILEAKRLLDDGNSMYKVIGSKYNENLITESLNDTDGYYFPRGIMEKDYEDAAFSLQKNGDRTDIITSYGKSPSGAYVECFYIIEKLAVKDSEIDANFTYLSDMVKDSIIAKEKEVYREKLRFTPNDYTWSLDLSNLEAPKNGADYTLIIAIVASVLGLALIIVAVFVFRSVRAKKFHKKHKR
ncbi:MAG: hypothetical protein E7678_04900 [Ruminococcaceae bacterium]|nr:hypothetical protein [Oscillospiraceae bacterium]